MKTVDSRRIDLVGVRLVKSLDLITVEPDTEDNLLLLDEDNIGVGVTLDEATLLQIDGNRFTPYIEIKTIHVTPFDI